jgi:hypothetical protein
MLANDETDILLYACILNVDHDNKRTIFKELLKFYFHITYGDHERS